MSRVRWVDALRGLAIVLMVIFHFCYDLRYFGYVDWDVPNGSNWRPFRYVILSLFIFTVGLSLSLAHGGAAGIRWRPFLFRLGQLIAASILITVMSLWMFPTAWIYFGILHFIAFATLVGVALVRVPWIALAVGLLVFSLYWSGIVPTRWPFILFQQVLPRFTEDFVPLFPWLGVMCFGVAIAGLLPVRSFDFPDCKASRWGSLIGSHGLIIYVVHQPLLFGGFMAVKLLVGAN